MIKIHFLNRTLFILSELEDLDIDLEKSMIKKSDELFEDFIMRFERSDDIRNSVVYSDYPEDTIIEIGQIFKFIEAAGRIVNNNRSELLIIERLGKNDLPKGKVEKGERIEDAAKREIEEECGYCVEPESLFKIASFYTSVGFAGSRQTLFYTEVDESMKCGPGGGVEGEKIEIVEVPVRLAENIMRDDDIAKTPGLLFAIEWWFAHQGSLRSEIENP